MKIVEIQPASDVRHLFPMARWPGHACCCAAPPVVKVVMPVTRHRDHNVELYLCGHHYRASRTALGDAGATIAVRDRRLAVWR
jgi:hypothetical protein